MSILLKILGDYCIGEPPLTIPNREVKPICADGTAYCGRVGRCLSYLIPSGFPGGIFSLYSFLRLYLHPLVRRIYFISILIFAAALLAQGQVIDTTMDINTWMLKHNFTRFEDVPLDTNTHQLQRDYNPAYQQGFSYE